MSELDVVVVVGTDHHPFDRLVAWVDRWAALRGNGERVLIQHGSTGPPTTARAVEFLARDDLLATFAQTRVVVSHGGPSLIVESLRAGRLPIVLPRSPDLGEHVDGHQQRFVAAMVLKGMVREVATEAELAALLDAEIASTGPAPVLADLPPASDAARALGAAVAELVADGPTRRLAWLRRRARR